MQSKVINNGCIELNQFGHQFYTTRSTYLQKLAFQSRIGRLNLARCCLFSQILIVTLLIRSFSACMTTLQRQGNLGTSMCFQA